MSYDLVDEFCLCPPYGNGEVWTDYMLNLILEKSVDYFWPVTEPEIKIVNGKKDLFSKTTVIMNQEQVLKVAMDKGETAAFLLENGVLTPKTWVSLPREEVSYPIIIKEKFGCGSHGVILAKNEEELVQSFQQMKSPIVQEHVGTKEEEYTLTIFSDGTVVNSIAFQRELGFGGMSRYVEVIRDEKFEEIADKISKMFQLRGSINVQLRKRNEEYYVFEINPRISSTMGFRMQVGFNDVSWWMDMLEGRAVEKYQTPAGKIYGVRRVEEKIFFEKPNV